MRRIGPFLAGALLLLTNMVVLLGVASNRRDEPDASVVLTERELPIAPGEKENSAMSLNLDWFATDTRWDREPGWFDREKLEEVGFDCSLPLIDPSAELRYGKALPLQGYVVLEFEGDAWRRWLAGQEGAIRELESQVARGEETPKALEERRKQLASDRISRSRLFAIDAGRDATALRRRYPDRSRYIVTGAILRLEYRKQWDQKTHAFREPFLSGSVSELLVSTIHVPLDQRPILDALMKARGAGSGRAAGESEHFRYEYGPSHIGPPRYEVTLDYGRRFEPWIAGVRRLEAGRTVVP